MSALPASLPALSQHLAAVWSLDPNAVAIEFKDQRITWGQMRALAGRVDQLLNAQPGTAGSAVGIMLRNRPGVVCAFVGLLATGRAVVSINPHYPAETLAAELKELNLAAIVGDEMDWRDPAIRGAARESGTLGISLRADASGADAVTGLETVGAGAHRTLPEGVALEILTSGTTGKPKRIQAKYSALGEAVTPAGKDGKPRVPEKLKDSATVVAGPMVHVSGIFGSLHPFGEGRPIVLLEKYNIQEFADAIERHKIKFASIPPTVMRMLLDAKFDKSKFASLVAVRSGTAPLPPETQRQFQDTYGVPVLIQYTATEWLGGIAGWSIDDHRKYMPAKLGSVGRPLPGVGLRVVDPENGNVLPAGETGLLEVRAERRFGANAKWDRTTDLAKIDADGFLYIMGRADDAIIRGGFKVHLPAVAEVVNSHPAVLDSSVLGMPDERLGQVPVCAVELRQGQPRPTEAELEQFCRAKLLPYQVPVRFKILDALPRTVSMKVDRPAVRKLFA
jgi:acyl-CoA synthetase (AMP-forming)/AMP-acid ligase II